MSFEMDLRPFGFDTTVNLIGDLVDSFVYADSPLFFLFDENHAFSKGIADSLRNACVLIDDGVVDSVGVEGYPEGIKQHFVALSSKVGMTHDDYMAKFESQRMSDESLIARSTTTRLRFGEVLFLLRPKLLIDTVEDADLYFAARDALKRIKKEVESKSMESAVDVMMNAFRQKQASNTPMPSQKELKSQMTAPQDKLLSALTNQIRAEVQEPRDKAMMNNMFRIRSENDCINASIINAGTKHQDWIFTELRRQKLASAIRIRPTNFPTAGPIWNMIDAD